MEAWLRQGAEDIPGNVKGASVFSPEAEARLANYVTRSKANGVRDWDTALIYRLMHIMGHVTPRATFRYYIHTFCLIQRFFVREICQASLLKLSAGVLACCVPQMRDAATRVQMKDKSIAGVLAWLKQHRPQLF